MKETKIIKSNNQFIATAISASSIGLNALDYSEAIVATIHEPIIILDKDLRVKYANQSFYKNFHVSESETIGNLLSDLGNKQWNIPSLKKLLEDIILKNSEFYDYEITHNFPEIGEKIMLLNAKRLMQESHSEQLILLAIHDATEVRTKALKIKKIEIELLKKNSSENKIEKVRLEKAVEERTQELIQANKELVTQYLDKEKRASELIIANKELAFQNEEKEKRAAELMIANKELLIQNNEKEKKASELVIANREVVFEYLEKEKRAAELIIANKELAFQNEEKEKRATELIMANKELSAFNYISSHDLQEPLRKIQVFISKIFDDATLELSEKNKDYFIRMQSSANRMQILIDDLLAYSRLNITDIVFEKIIIHKIVEEVVQEFSLAQSIEEKNAIINYAKLPEIKGIPFQLKQLFTNLIINSLKYSEPNKAPIIDIQSAVINGVDVLDNRADKNKRYHKITIADNGIGFEQQYAEKIFTLFQRLHDKQSFSGTGIGLAICKKVVENHQGFIVAKGIPNHGATFDIYLPVV